MMAEAFTKTIAAMEPMEAVGIFRQYDISILLVLSTNFV
jgi:hypothetical protein